MVPGTSRKIRLETLAYGGDYNPDQWDEATWREDIQLMQEAKVTMVTLPVFSWPQLEVTPGVYQWGWLDRILELLTDAGIRIDMATATATPPAWLVRRHPEILPWTQEGHQLEFGSRQAYCPSSPIWREHVARMTTAMATRYGNHPGIAMWHISNEYGDHISRCWCPESAAHFRRWLIAQYGNLDQLNAAWGTAVWGQRYQEWDHIEPPRRSSGPINPAHQMDFERFSSDALLELFQLEIDILRDLTPSIPVTTNFMSLFRDLNYWDFAAMEDIVTDDAYPDPSDPNAHIHAALNYGFMRSLKRGQPWLLLEQAPSAVSWREVNVPKAPGKMRTDSFQAIAHGSDGAMCFQWRQARFGQEKFHSAMLGHRGAASRTYQEARALGQELQKLSMIRGTLVRSRIALVVDYDSWWGTSAAESLPSQRLDWLTQARVWHHAIYALGQPVDTIPAEGPFQGYDVVVVPNLYLTTAQQAQALHTYVNAGGHLIVGPFSGVVNIHETIHDGGPPGPLADVLGLHVDEPWPLADHHEVQVTGTQTWPATIWTEWLEPHPDTEVIARYTSGDLAGRAAITRRRHHSGTATYLSCVMASEALSALFRELLTLADIPVRDHATLDVETLTRSDTTTDYTFIMNHGTHAHTVQIPDGATRLTGPIPAGNTLTLNRYDVAVWATPRGAQPPFLTVTAVTPRIEGMP